MELVRRANTRHADAADFSDDHQHSRRRVVRAFNGLDAADYNMNLVTTNWLGVTNAVNVVGSANQILDSAPAGNKYFRLSNP